jgi:hypothetical protein
VTDAVRLDAAIASCRQRANQESLAPTTAFMTDLEITSLYNYFLRRVYTRIVRARSAGYYRAFTSVAVVNGVSLYALAAQVFEIISCSFIGGQLANCPIYEYTESERHMYDAAPGWSRYQRICFQLQGNNINFIPVPSGAYTVQINYVPAYIPLVAAGDLFDGVVGFEDAAIWETVAAMNAKDEADPSFAMAQAARMYEEIDALASSRNNANAPRVQRVRSARRRGNWNY